MNDRKRDIYLGIGSVIWDYLPAYLALLFIWLWLEFVEWWDLQ